MLCTVSDYYAFVLPLIVSFSLVTDLGYILLQCFYSKQTLLLFLSYFVSHSNEIPISYVMMNSFLLTKTHSLNISSGYYKQGQYKCDVTKRMEFREPLGIHF